MNNATVVLERLLRSLPPSEHVPLVLGRDESLVPLSLIDDPAWVAEQIRLRGERWNTNDRRVLVTLWWYSASSWTIGPTLTSLVMGSDLLSAEVSDLDLHWLPDSRVTGATSRRVLHGDDRLALAGESLRSLYSYVLPILAEYGHMRERPLWAIAADAIANRLLWLGRALSSELENVKRVTSLLDPLTEQIGGPLPLTRYTRTDDFEAMHTHRCSCCLLFLTPQGGKCASCPRGGDLRVTAQCS